MQQETVQETTPQAASQENDQSQKEKASKDAPQQDAAKKEAEQSEAGESAELAPSSNEQVVSKEEAPKVFWAMDIVYHLEGCKAISGQEVQEVPWDLVQQIGLRQCPECNPPQYEGYVAAQ